MHLLDGQAVREQRVVGGTRCIGDVGGKEIEGACGRAGGARAINFVHGVVHHVVQANALAGIGQGHGTALFQAPLAGRADGAINPARSRRGAQYHAGVGLVEAVGHLHRNHRPLAARAVVEHRHVFAARNQPLAGRDCACSRDIGAIQAAVAPID